MIVIAITILLIITTIVPSKTVGFGSEVEVKEGMVRPQAHLKCIVL